MLYVQTTELCKPLAHFWLLLGGVVLSTLRLVQSPKQRSQALEILHSVLGPIEAQPGCLSCQIYSEEGPEHATLLCGYWETEAALEEHIRSDLYLRVLASCELSIQPPQFCFHYVSKTQGMDLVQQLRGCSGDESPGDLSGLRERHPK
jgi:quinol monooxygenase YgiN